MPNSHFRPIYTTEEAAEASSLARSNNQIVGLCHGCFDIIHAGHVRHFQEARNHVDILFLSVSSDEACRKGEGRPAFTQDQRLACAASIALVDAVVASAARTATPMIEAVRPDLYFKGPDYSETGRGHKGLAAELKALHQVGGVLRITSSRLVASSTQLLAASVMAQYD